MVRKASFKAATRRQSLRPNAAIMPQSYCRCQPLQMQMRTQQLLLVFIELPESSFFSCVSARSQEPELVVTQVKLRVARAQKRKIIITTMNRLYAAILPFIVRCLVCQCHCHLIQMSLIRVRTTTHCCRKGINTKKKNLGGMTSAFLGVSQDRRNKI